MQEESDENLMIRVKNGDALAFSILMDRYKQAVINLVAYTIGDNIDSEDIAQHVFIRVYKNASNYEVRSKFTTWLFTITKNLALNEIRRRKRHPTDSLDVVEQEEDYSKTKQYPDTKAVAPDDSMMNDEMQKCLKAALEALPERQRLALLMFQEQGLSYEEISEILEISLASTKSLIFRARDALKKTLKEYLSSESAT
ncbi:MAG: sigma-70 family RNA polymerase sigma factor [Verrucomicrobia bacterium]|nr:sigma-70 family RNA polymerase sigma factor [Verrucomicrobiota bacterium]